jgi:hypothetical protein
MKTTILREKLDRCGEIFTEQEKQAIHSAVAYIARHPTPIGEDWSAAAQTLAKIDKQLIQWCDL